MDSERVDIEWDEPEEDAEEAEQSLTGPPERMRITVGKKQEQLRIDKFLMNHVEGATRNKIQQAIDEGLVLVNGGNIKSSYKIRPLDEIVIMETRKGELIEVIPEPMDLEIVYEDDHILIVNKHPGIVVHPGCGNYTGTLVNGLAWHLGHREAISDALPRVGLVHRIDKDTSGLVVVGKTEAALTSLGAQFKKHTVHRRYVALAWGDFDENSGTVEAHIGRNLRFRKIMAAFPDGDHGKHAITHYEVKERFNYVTQLELRLETGRTHQIRVHMAMLGHPLFNDGTYGGDTVVKGTVFAKYKQFVDNCFKVLSRHALHARELGFTHPGTGQWIQFESELPDDMKTVIEKWRAYTGGMTSQLKAGLGGH